MEIPINTDSLIELKKGFEPFYHGTDSVLCGRCKNGNFAGTEHEPLQFSYCRMGLVAEMGPTIKHC